MKPILWTLTLLAVGMVNGTTYADHDYGIPYSGGSAFRGAGAYHRSSHRRQTHVPFHDSMSHRNFDGQYNGNGYGWMQPYSGGFHVGNRFGNSGSRSASHRGYNHGW